jgi:pilus assembly protein Flp/PilA
MKNLFVRFIREDEGQDLIEYAFLAVFIALAVTAAIQGIGTALSTQFSNIASSVGGAS